MSEEDKRQAVGFAADSIEDELISYTLEWKRMIILEVLRRMLEGEKHETGRRET